MIKLKDGRAELYQWDTGRLLSVPNDCSQVHFSNKPFGRSVDVDVADGEAVIPDFLLQTAKPIWAWCFVGTAENGYTKISKQFEVVSRNKPADYVFTPTEQLTLRELEQRVENLEKTGGGGGGSATPGKDGEDGGYYTPSVTQPNANTMRMDFTPSKADMPPVAGVEITLPAGPAGADGKPGADGAPGYTPQKGVDYFTNEDKEQMVADVLAALPVWEGGSY